jgi:energy-coupling factor transporter transmembrane protein EcfT
VNRPSLFARKTSPAARVLCSIIVVGAVALTPAHATAAAAAAVLVALTLLVTRPDARQLVLRAVPALLAIGALVLPLLLSGRPHEAGAIALRACLATVAALAFASTIAPGQLGAALLSLGVPPVLGATIETMLRQLSTLESEGRRIAFALRLRGARGSTLTTHVCAALLVRSAARAERVDLAMRLRGYDVRYSARSSRLRASDLPALVLLAAAAAALQLSVR